MNDDFNNKEYREAFVEANIHNGVAFQIRALRKKKDWSQGVLGEKSGKAQNVISRLEDPDYGKFTIQTLLSLAAAFDVALLVKFVSYSELLGQLRDLSPEALAVPSFDDEMQSLLSGADKTIGMFSEPKFSNKIRTNDEFAFRMPVAAVGALTAMKSGIDVEKAKNYETALCSVG